jgi:poly(beta-D-mannuronate) lyase
MIPRAVVAAAFALGLLTKPAYPDPLVSVKNPDASYFDVSDRRGLFARTSDPVLRQALDLASTQPAQCQNDGTPPPKPGAYTIPPYYEDRDAWQVAVQPYHDLQQALTGLGMRYSGTNDTRAAQCLVSILARWADAGALLDFRPDTGGRRQAWYLTTWTTVSAAMAYSLVRGEPELDSVTQRMVESWLNRVARNLLSIQTKGTDGQNNHAHWRALAATATGVVSKDHALFATGISGYRRAIAALSSDGSWPLEMARGERAIHYQNFALEPLIFLRAFAIRQGVDLDHSDQLATLDSAVSYLLHAMTHPETVSRYTTRPQDLSFLARRPTTSPLAALELIAAESPSAVLEEILAPHRPLVDRRVAAATTLYFYRPAR